MLTIFREFRALVSAVQELVVVLRGLLEAQEAAGPALDRLAALELSRHKHEAEIEGMLLKAENKLKAASNAEARERQLKKSYENTIIGPLDADGEQGSEAQAVRGFDAAASEEAGVPPLRLAVATNPKAAAVRAKFGL